MKVFLICFASFLTILTVAKPTRSQQSLGMREANELFRHEKWAEAEAAYRSITVKEPDNALAWQNLGESLLQQHKHEAAEAAFQQAMKTGQNPEVNQVNLARVYADTNESEKAFTQLQKLIDGGKGAAVRPLVRAAAEFSKWKDEPKFKELLEKMAPCRQPEYRQFDFWIGDWEVRAPQGPIVGRSSVTVEQEGCLLVEHWTSLKGAQTGTSFNYYNVHDKKWHQLYIDNSGNAESFPAMAGNLIGGRMVLLTDEKERPVSRWTWYVLGPGKVRQMAEQSSDGQKTWNITWDSEYFRTNPENSEATK
jgi:tetratricopeptide (TPR) repeat protein